MKRFVFLHAPYPFVGSFMEGLAMLQGRKPAHIAGMDWQMVAEGES
jgi:hypothetical protein